MQDHNKHYVFLIYVVLILAVIIAFEPVRHNDFVDYDDQRYVTENPHVKAGITRESIVWAFTGYHQGGLWHPLAALSNMLDCQLFGLNPFWHHLTSLLFHIANTVLLFWVLKRMTGVVFPSAFVAAVFALHPLSVDSVAWVAERKNVLSGFFWLLTIAAYARYAEHPGIGRYLLVVLVFCLALLSKPMVVTLPFVLLLLDYWPLGRFQWGYQKANKDLPKYKLVKVRYQKSPTLSLVIEKIPLLALSAVLSVITVFVQRHAGAVFPLERLPLDSRIANALVSYVRYIGKMIYPSKLAAFYPHPLDRLPLWQPIVCFVILIVISALIIISRKRYLVVGWLWYLGTLVPVIGLVQVGEQAMANRYTYLPLIGIYIMVAWGAAELVVKWRYRKFGLGLAAGIVFIVLLICTWVQVRHWQNNLTLFGYTVAVTENNYKMHNNYGAALQKEGRLEEAFAQYKESLRIAPQYFRARNNLGAVYLQKGEIKQAIACWNEALRYKSDNVEVINNLAWVRATWGNPEFRNSDEAVRLATRACELTGYAQPDILDTLAAAYAAAGKFPQAIETAKKAFKLAEDAGREDLAKEIQGRLQLYKSNQPYREK